MELSKAFSVQTDYLDRRTPPSWDMFLFAEVVFVDKTNAGVAPLVYQMNNSAQFPHVGFLSNNVGSWQDHCTLLGEINEELDKKKKLITLVNKRVVSYKHLIIINGKKPLLSTINHEITNALHALIEALKVNPSMNTLLLPSWSLRQPLKDPKNPTESAESDLASNVGKVSHSHFTSHKGTNTAPFELDAINERLYEIYI